MQNPALFVRVSTPDGFRTVSAFWAARAGWKVVDRPALDRVGNPLPLKPRVSLVAAMPEPDTEAPVSADYFKE